ncbi:MAG: MCP four helix bundle domain-containing protein [Magnetococcus sp. YQC-9]
MSVLSNLKIAHKIYGLVLVAILAVVGIATTDQYQMSKIFNSANYATINTVPSFISIYEVQGRFLKIRILARDHALNTDDMKMVALDRQIQEEREIIAKEINRYEDKLLSDADDLKLLNASRSALKDYNLGLDQMLSLSRQNKNVEARGQLEKIVTPATAVEHALQEHIDFNKRLAESGSAEALATKSAATWIAALLSVLIVASLGVIGWGIANAALARPIGLVADSLQQLAQGRMDVAVGGGRASRRDRRYGPCRSRIQEFCGETQYPELAQVHYLGNFRSFATGRGSPQLGPSRCVKTFAGCRCRSCRFLFS